MAKFLVPPHNREAETGVIGGLFIEPSLISEAAAAVNPEEFYSDCNEIVFRLMLELYHSNKPIDFVTIEELAIRKGVLDKFGGLNYLRECTDRTASSANVVYYSKIVHENALKRGLLQFSRRLEKISLDETLDCYEQLEVAEREFMQLATGKQQQSERMLSEVLARTIDKIERRANNEIPYLRTGFEEVDTMLGGLEPNYLVIVAARPSMGKTAFAMNIAENVARMRTPVYVASIEQSDTEIGERMLSGYCGIDSRKFKGKTFLNQDEWNEMYAGMDRLAAANIMISDASSQSPSQIASGVRRFARKYGAPVTIIDHVGLVEVTGDLKKDQRHQQLKIITRQFKMLSKEIGQPVIVLCQLNREVTKRENNKPRMADLKESGGIEENADVVVLLHRPEYYDPEDQPGVAEVFIAKNRNGAVGTCKLTFNPAYTRFEDRIPEVNF